MNGATRHIAAAAITLATAFSSALFMPALADDAQPKAAQDANPRILSLGGDVTEILYDLGQADKVVAVDSTSQFPAQALKDKKNVGYLRALSAEGVLSINPNVIVASEQAGPPEVVKALKSTNIRYVEIDDNPSADGVPAKVRSIGDVVGARDAAEALATKIQTEFDALASDRKTLGKHKRVLFVLSVQNGRAVVGGGGTSADAILQLAGADNAAAKISGFKPVSDEQLAEFAPDALVIMRRGEASRHGAEQARSLAGLSGTPASKEENLIEMDGLYLLGFGPRAPAAARDLMQKLYPQMANATQSSKP